ncbi:hypothetical protein ACX93W_09660 [Paenibacillus sp. CAU 1782]
MSEVSISLTQFIDFTLKQGPSKVNAVRKIKTQGVYHPAFDYWRELRGAIKKIHEENKDLSYLDQLLNNVHHRKTNQYTEAIKQYKRFVRNKEIEWFDPGKAFWSSGELAVRATPELGLIINGQPHLIKLYFKGTSEKLEKRTAMPTLTLLSAATRSEQIPNATNSVLNIKKSTLYPVTSQHNQTDMILSLKAEAAHFIHIWDNL